MHNNIVRPLLQVTQHPRCRLRVEVINERPQQVEHKVRRHAGQCQIQALRAESKSRCSLSLQRNHTALFPHPQVMLAALAVQLLN